MPLIALKHFSSLPEAELACNLLKENGLPCILQKDGIPGSTGAIEGAEVVVDEKYRDQANEILSE